MSASKMPQPNPLFSILANPDTRAFLTTKHPPEVLQHSVTTLPFSRKLVCAPVTNAPRLVHGIAVTESPSGYALCVIDEEQKAVLLVGECREGTEVVIISEREPTMTRFDGNTFEEFLSGGQVSPVQPGDCFRRIPRNTGEWGHTNVEEAVETRIRKWISSPGKLACPVALLNGKIRMCRGLAVWELLANNEAETQPQRRLVKLAPAPVSGVGGSVVKEVVGEVEERRRKAELRKARNRESAQRSNMRRKMKLQALKEELERISLREKRLRKREKDLREENSELKMTVSR